MVFDNLRLTGWGITASEEMGGKSAQSLKVTWSYMTSR